MRNFVSNTSSHLTLILLLTLACISCGGGSGGNSATAPINKTPVIQLSSSALAFTATIGGTAPASQTFQVQNTNSNSNPASQPLALSSDSTWLTISPASGSTSYTSPQAITATVSQTGLTAGTYNGNITITASGASGSPAKVAVTLTLATALPTVESHPDLRRRVIYQIVTDRFFNGDTSNDNPSLSPGLFDSTQTNWQLYWGGDLAGIQAKLSYLKSLGVGAIWISPPVDNANTPNSYNGAVYAPYHGYCGRDYKRIDEHFGDSTNSWAAFDNLISTAHSDGIQVIVDFATNDSNLRNASEYGALYDDGVKLTDYNSDASLTGTSAFYHHNANISDWTDPYQLQYGTLSDLADFNQENSTVDKYLKDSVALFLSHGVDGFRFDAVKHANWGWEYTLSNSAQTASSKIATTTTMPPYLFGEWMEGIGDPLFPNSVKWANGSGITILDYALYYDVASAFAKGGSFYTVDSDISTESADFSNPNDLVTFIDNHDNARLQSQGATSNQLNEALAFELTCRGVPVVYYGDEQYLHVDTAGGGDPYTRAEMSNFDLTTTAAQVVRYLSALRSSNTALAYGTMKQRWITNDVYIFERRFNDSIVLVAINKSETTDQSISGLYTALPAGTYADYMNGLIGGLTLQVTDAGGNNPATNFSLPKHSVSVWQVKGSTAAQAGGLTPRQGQPAVQASITGSGFGVSPGSVKLDGTPASIASWSDDTVIFAVPSMNAGPHTITMNTSANTSVLPPSNFTFTVLEAPQISVTIALHGAPALAANEQYFLTGNIVELGNNVTDFSHAVGPLLIPPTGDPFITVPLPAGTPASFSFFRLVTGTTTPSAREGTTHTYTAPTSGTDSLTVTWLP